jgi:hypothetical protein
MNRQSRLRLISTAPYLVVALTLFLVVMLLGWVFFQPTIAELWMIEAEMPRYESQFGFQGGWMEHSVPGGKVWKAYGIVRVEPKGRLAGLGFLDGDIPVAHHGDGIGWFCWALDQAEAGKAAEVWVVNPRIGSGADGQRKVVIPASTEKAPMPGE